MAWGAHSTERSLSGQAFDANDAAGRGHYVIKYRSKKDDDASIAILAKHWAHTSGIYADALHCPSAEPLPPTVDHNMRLVRTRLNHYYLCIPIGLDVRGENQASPADADSTIALDPGAHSAAQQDTN